MERLISVDFYADFGMLKKPDTNEPVYLTFNMLHKPALLGIIGAIIGESGFKENKKLPDYYIKLKDIKVSIQPIQPYHDKGNFKKTIISYNNATGMASKEPGGNLMVREQTLIAPAYRCYFLLDTQNLLHNKINENLKNYTAEYLPYLGKNEFSLWWKDYKTYEYQIFKPENSFRISSLFIKNEPVSKGKDIQPFIPDYEILGNSFIYFERLPYEYDEKLFQYSFRDFAYTDWLLKPQYPSNYPLLKIQSDEVIQIF